MSLFDGVPEDAPTDEAIRADLERDRELELEAARADVCPRCGGSGRGNPLIPSRNGPGPCPDCGGSGVRRPAS